MGNDRLSDDAFFHVSEKLSLGSEIISTYACVMKIRIFGYTIINEIRRII